MFANDSQRLYDVCCMAPLIFGGPFVAVIATAYTVYLLGPHALIGMLVFILYYPIQFGVSVLTGSREVEYFHFRNSMHQLTQNSGYFRSRTIVVTDKRVTLMKELLTCVKLIKMYAWEKPFSKTITGILQSSFYSPRSNM